MLVFFLTHAQEHARLRRADFESPRTDFPSGVAPAVTCVVLRPCAKDVEGRARSKKEAGIVFRKPDLIWACSLRGAIQS
jgi:hypothetical protein